MLAIVSPTATDPLCHPVTSDVGTTCPSSIANIVTGHGPPASTLSDSEDVLPEQVDQLSSQANAPTGEDLAELLNATAFFPCEFCDAQHSYFREISSVNS
jgi:hypothetical protein